MDRLVGNRQLCYASHPDNSTCAHFEGRHYHRKAARLVLCRILAEEGGGE